MATKSKVDAPTGKKFLPNFLHPNTSRMEYILDLSKDNADSGDIYQIIPIPAKSLVSAVYYEVLTVEGSAATFDVGDGTTSGGYASGKDANALTVGCSSPPALAEGAPNTFTPVYGPGKFYSAADTVDVKCNAAMDKAKIRVVAIITTFDKDF